MTSTLAFQAYREGLVRLFYPAACSTCQNLLELEESVICDSCWDELERFRFSALQMGSGESPEGISDSWSLYLYQDRVRQLISDFKYEGHRQILAVFLPALTEAARVLSGFQHYDGILEIPADPKRKQDRAYSPVRLIADQIAKDLGTQRVTGLEKTRSTPPQMELGFEERHYNLQGAFRAHGDRLSGKRLLLIDDIVTTGSTASEAAKALRKAGAKKIDLLTLARAERVL